MDKDFFNKIDTKEKAYIAGFLIGDGSISKNYDVDLALCLNDKQVLYDISKIIPWKLNVVEDKTLNKKSRRFPRARLCFRSRSMGKHLVKHFGDRLASMRRTPRIPLEMEPYFVSGFFDADGCITWGYRKDRNRLWHKVSFTAADTILIGIQNILLKNSISTIIRPKKNENVYLIEFANKKDILKFYEYLPNKSIRLKRKVLKFDKLVNEIKQ